jgi:hypothetical protein
MPPDAFERLARRLLREAESDSVNVTGQAVTAGSPSTGSAWSAFRSSFSARDTAAAWSVVADQPQSALGGIPHIPAVKVPGIWRAHVD